MRVWETSLRGEVSKGKRALVFQMNPARLEPEGFLQSLTPKNLFLGLKAAAAAENSASAFSGTIVCAGHAVAPTSSTTGPSVQSGEGPGTHTHISKAKRRRIHFSDTGLGLLAQKSSKQCSILQVAEAGWVKDDRTQQEGRTDSKYTLLASPAAKMLLLCTAMCSLA